MNRSPLLAGLLAALLLPTATAEAGISVKAVKTTKHGGGIVERQERVTIDGRTSDVFTVTMPKPGRGRALEPYLPNNIVSAGTTTSSRITGELKPYGHAVAVNADLFEYATGQPSGLFMVDGDILNQPQGGRPALFMQTDGMLGMTTPKTSGVITIGKRKIPFEVNVRRTDGVVLYDYGWGKTVPPGVRHTITAVPTAADLFQRDHEWGLDGEMRVTASRGGALPIPRQNEGDELIAAYGSAAKALSRARRGQKVGISYRFGPLPGEVRHGVGGGPVLVQDGKVVYERSKYGEFSDSQLVPPDARTAVGQYPDGRIVFYAVDEVGGSAGFTVSEVARDLQHRGVDRAMAFDSGGSTAVSVDGRLLNKPSDGYERQVGNLLVYFRPKAAYRRPIGKVTVAPPKPGERAPRLAFSLRGNVKTEVTLRGPRGTVAAIDTFRRKGRHVIRFPEDRLRTGSWEFEVLVPDYQDLVIKDFRVRAKARPVADTTPAAGDEATADDAAAADEDAPAEAEDVNGDDQGSSSTLWIVLAVVVVLAIAAAATIVRRRRR